MIILKIIRSRHFHTYLRAQTPSNYFKNPPQNPHFSPSLVSSNSDQFSFISSISRRSFSLSAHFVQISNGNSPKTKKPLTSEQNSPKTEKPLTSEQNSPKTEKPLTSEQNSPKIGKPLSVFFKEAVWISGKTDSGEFDFENAELIEKLRNLGEKIDSLDKKKHEKGENLKPLSINRDGNVPSGDKRRLSDSFVEKKTKKIVKLDRIDLGNDDSKLHKPLSSDMELVAYHLYTGGYLKNANFIHKNKFDATCFEASYARNYLKRAAVDFGRDHQEIAKWLSASDMKNIALFGCPSLGEKSVQAAKHLRAFFKIDEQKVCHKCVLKESCKLANKTSWKDSSKLRLGDVTRVLVMYALDLVPQKLVVPEEIKNAVGRLLKEVVNLSNTVSKDLSKTADLQ